MDNNQFGEFVIKLRKEKGLTQKQLGDKLFLIDKAISKWERGLSFPDITILKSLAIVLEVDISELLNCKKGESKEIDLQKTVDDLVDKIDKKRILKNKRIFYISSVIIIIISLIIYVSISYYNRYHPKTIIACKNNFVLDEFNLSKDGFEGFKKLIEKSYNMTDKYT